MSTSKTSKYGGGNWTSVTKETTEGDAWNPRSFDLQTGPDGKGPYNELPTDGTNWVRGIYTESQSVDVPGKTEQKTFHVIRATAFGQKVYQDKYDKVAPDYKENGVDVKVWGHQVLNDTVQTELTPGDEVVFEFEGRVDKKGGGFYYKWAAFKIATEGGNDSAPAATKSTEATVEAVMEAPANEKMEWE